MTLTVAGTAGSPVRRLLTLARPLRPTLALAVLAGALTVGCGIALLGVSGYLIARASEHPNEVALAVAVVAVRAFGIGRGVFRYVERLSTHDAAFRVMADLRVSIYRRLERLVPSGLDIRSSDLLARLISDVDAVQDLFIRGIVPILVAAGVGAATIAAVFAIFRPGAVAVGAGLVAAGLAVPVVTTRLAARSDAKRAAAQGGLAIALNDVVSGAAELLAFGAADDALLDLDAKDASLTRIARRSAVVSAVGVGLASVVTGTTVWALLLLAVSSAHSGGLSRVSLAAVVLTGLAAFEATGPLAAAAQQLTSVRSSAGRIFEVLDTPDPLEAADQPSRTIPTGPVHVRVEGARLRYAPDAPWALDGVDLDLPYGRRVAITGRSGSGKSSLASALVRFRDLDEGTITVSGVPVTALDDDLVRTVISGCLADPYVFDSTVRENLLLARSAATQGELDAVCQRVRLLDWIHSLPAGWDTRVGTHGGVVSGGQRQRLALARALLADPPVLILDEPTAHLDLETSTALWRDIEAATRDRTTLVITHDLSHLEMFDEVVVLDAGRVVQPALVP